MYQNTDIQYYWLADTQGFFLFLYEFGAYESIVVELRVQGDRDLNMNSNPLLYPCLSLTAKPKPGLGSWKGKDKHHNLTFS